MPCDPGIEPTALPSLASFRLLDVGDPAAFDAGHAARAARVPIELGEAVAMFASVIAIGSGERCSK